MAIFQQRGWDPLEDDAVLLEERDFDYVAGETVTNHTYLSVGERRSVTFRVRCYTATELVKLLAEVGFTDIECFGDRRRAPLARDAPRRQSAKALGVLVGEAQHGALPQKRTPFTAGSVWPRPAPYP